MPLVWGKPNQSALSHGSIADMDFCTSLLLEINRLIEGEYLEVRTTCPIQSALVPHEGAEQRNIFRRAEFRQILGGLMGKCCIFTVDGECGRRLRLADHVLRHTGIGANVCRDKTTYLQGVVFADLVSGQQEGNKP